VAEREPKDTHEDEGAVAEPEHPPRRRDDDEARRAIARVWAAAAGAEGGNAAARACCDGRVSADSARPGAAPTCVAARSVWSAR